MVFLAVARSMLQSYNSDCWFCGAAVERLVLEATELQKLRLAPASSSTASSKYVEQRNLPLNQKAYPTLQFRKQEHASCRQKRLPKKGPSQAVLAATFCRLDKHCLRPWDNEGFISMAPEFSPNFRSHVPRGARQLAEALQHLRNLRRAVGPPWRWALLGRPLAFFPAGWCFLPIISSQCFLMVLPPNQQTVNTARRKQIYIILTILSLEQASPRPNFNKLTLTQPQPIAQHKLARPYKPTKPALPKPQTVLKLTTPCNTRLL